MSKIKNACEFSTKVRNDIKKRQAYKCLFCNKEIDHIHHAIVGRRVGLGVEQNGIGLCLRHHTLVHSSGKIAQKLNEEIELYLTKYYGKIDKESLKYTKWNGFKFK